MAMTLRLTEEETDALRDQAAVEDRSMQEVVRSAVREYVARRAHQGSVVAETDWAVGRYADLLDALGKA